MEKEQKEYEVGYLLSPLIPEDKLDEEISLLRKEIEDKKGLIVTEFRARMQRLAYPIKKVNTAYFGWIKFVLAPEDLVDVEAKFKKNNNILRYLITKAVKEMANPKAIKRTIKKAKTAAVEKAEKGTIKEAEIDKKLEEILSA